ncbi:hypothetical protein B7P43_G07115 [Cryptotermes secundus]|uniref:Mos1 transposase HTH domain-containing protein n=1 Tax=Cryptotermes secundus TaxID=105785 RepID=A0A2J7Q2A0_9NEOP|nr:hypothetical protein B7P43_G07115 [Cryptotermes secundus]
MRLTELQSEQQISIKFLVKFGKSGSEIREILMQVYRDNAMKKTAVYKWMAGFSDGRGSVTDEERWPATSRTDENSAKVHQITRENHQLTVRIITEEFLASKQITMLEHPPCSPDLAPSDFFFFPKIKEMLKGRHFDDIWSNTMAALKANPQNQFQNCFGLGAGISA